MRDFDGNLQEPGSKHNQRRSSIKIRLDFAGVCTAVGLVLHWVKKELSSPTWGGKVLTLWPPSQEVLQDVQPCAFQIQLQSVTNSVKYFSATFRLLDWKNQEQLHYFHLRTEIWNIFTCRFVSSHLKKGKNSPLNLYTKGMVKLLFWEALTLLTHPLSKMCSALLFSHPVHISTFPSHTWMLFSLPFCMPYSFFLSDLCKAFSFLTPKKPVHFSFRHDETKGGIERRNREKKRRKVGTKKLLQSEASFQLLIYLPLHPYFLSCLFKAVLTKLSNDWFLATSFHFTFYHLCKSATPSTLTSQES